MATGAALFVATPRSEAGDFSFSILFPFPCEPRPPVCPPPPPPPSMVWVPGHYETRSETIWVSGPCEQVWVPPRFEYVWKNHHKVRVLVTPGHYETIHHPGRYEIRETHVWVPGHYEYANDRDDHPGRGHAYGRYKNDRDRDDDDYSKHDKGSPSYF